MADVTNYQQVIVCVCLTARVLRLSHHPAKMQKTFTHVFIDEASQSTEPEVYVPLSLATASTCVVWRFCIVSGLINHVRMAVL